MTQHPLTREVSYSCTARLLLNPNKSEAGHAEPHCSSARWSCPSAQLQKEKMPSQAAVHLCAKPFLIFQAASLCLPSGSLCVPPMPHSRVFKQCSRHLAPCLPALSSPQENGVCSHAGCPSSCRGVPSLALSLPCCPALLCSALPVLPLLFCSVARSLFF